MKKEKFDLEKIEKIEEVEGVLTGGYSTVISGGNEGVWDWLGELLDIDVNNKCTSNSECTMNVCKVAKPSDEKKREVINTNINCFR